MGGFLFALIIFSGVGYSLVVVLRLIVFVWSNALCLRSKVGICAEDASSTLLHLQGSRVIMSLVPPGHQRSDRWDRYMGQVV